jgi:hypothetical protein
MSSYCSIFYQTFEMAKLVLLAASTTGFRLETTRLDWNPVTSQMLLTSQDKLCNGSPNLTWTGTSTDFGHAFA